LAYLFLVEVVRILSGLSEKNGAGKRASEMRVYERETRQRAERTTPSS
jgi:hypothetical protein